MNPRSLATNLVFFLVFSIPWEDTVEVPGVGTVSRAVGLVTAVVWFISLMSPGPRRPLHKFHGALFLFVVWTGMSIYWSVAPTRSISGFVTNVQLLILALIVWELLDSRHLIDRALQAYVLGSVVSVGGVVASYINNDPSKYLRFGAPGTDLDNNALILAIGIPAALYLTNGPAGRVLPRTLRIINYAYVPAAAYGMVLTGTRGAVLASIPTLVFGLWAFTRGAGGRRLAALVMVGAAVYAVASFAPTASIERIGSITTAFSSGSDLNGRSTIWRESLDAFVQRPLIGVGNDAHRASVDEGKVAHNTPLSAMTETGLIGLVLFFNVMAQAVKLARCHSGFAARFWATQLLVVALGSMSLSIEDRKYAWLFIALAVSSGGIIAEARTRRPTGELTSAIAR